jgi:hypothetical protein
MNIPRFQAYTSLNKRLESFGNLFSNVKFEKARYGFFLSKEVCFFICCNFCNLHVKYVDNFDWIHACHCTRTISNRKYLENVNTFKNVVTSPEDLARRGYFLQITMVDKFTCFLCGYSHLPFEAMFHENCPIALYNREIVVDNPVCSSCNVNKQNCAFLKCGHVLYCTVCASFREVCKICKTPISAILPIFF